MADFASNFKGAFESLDTERILNLFTEDVTLQASGIAQPIQGKQNVRRLLGETLKSIENVDVETKKVVHEGNETAAHVRARITFSDDLRFGGVTLPTSGRTTTLDAALFATLDEEGRAKEITRIRDNWQIMRDLGMSASDMEDVAKETVRMLQAEKKGAGKPVGGRTT